MKEYFTLIRKARTEDRRKGKGTYYEAHHIIPKSFGKVSSTVLLTPEEHYRAHKLLADYWKTHPVYGKKMLWAYHRIAYCGSVKLSEEEYASARKNLMVLWTREKSVEHRVAIGTAMKGNTNNKSRVYKGMKSDISEEGRKKLAEHRRKHQTGKTGLDAQAAKGPYTVTFETGETFTAGSYPELAKMVLIPYSTLQYRYVNNPGTFKNGWKIK